MSLFADKPRPETVSVVTLADGTERVAWRQGTGRPILLIQGMSGSHYEWGDDFVNALEASGRQIIGINHRGVCQEEVPAGGYTIADLADDQAQGLDALGITEPIDVFGTSMGGMVAQELVLRHPGKVRTLTLASTSAGGDAMTPPAAEDLIGLYEAQTSGDEERAARYGFELYNAPAWCAEPGNFEMFKGLSRHYPTPFETLLTQLGAVDGYTTAERLPTVTVPTVIVHGTIDRIMPFPNAAPLQAAIPGAELDVWEEGGHLLHLENGARLAEAINTVSARRDAAGASA
ncbi:MAG: alpha/beta hydrolase [Solirubrobacteraceae bacterium]|nr:alpha/beta hydrolase [Solirubrobacteraceae bacterium]